MNEIKEAQQAFRNAMAAGLPEQVSRTSERIRLLQRAQTARRMHEATSRTLRAARALKITL